jgi:uncharacterized protein (UPF0147 family)
MTEPAKVEEPVEVLKESTEALTLPTVWTTCQEAMALLQQADTMTESESVKLAIGKVIKEMTNLIDFLNPEVIARCDKALKQLEKISTNQGTSTDNHLRKLITEMYDFLSRH